ncbi:MAG: hypothetical protein CL763_07085 [Chloroflexi bacterium]|nr:hypothetical protein [Chloroflexota bacterium]|tara:strand:- start:703 stop:1200 length:498 start_codon:yes stop_codon:yes gene_type:complete
MKNSIGFRSWFYFRMGWSTYFAFIFAAINTLTVTYYLAIQNYPFLETIFPTFEQYIVIVILIGIPLLIGIGYAHYKRTLAFKSETDITAEANPYNRRNIVNNTISSELAIKNLELLIKLAKKETIGDEDLVELSKLHEKYSKLSKERTFSNNVDLKFLKENITNT